MPELDCLMLCLDILNRGKSAFGKRAPLQESKVTYDAVKTCKVGKDVVR